MNENEQLLLDAILEEDNKTKFEPAGEESAIELEVALDSFNDAVVWGTDWTTETVASQLVKGNIDLDPSFQRRDAWSDREKSAFIESLMLGIPVPPIILAENRSKKNSYIVIDGKQRLLSIRRFYEKITPEKENNSGFTPLKLRNLQILSSLNNMTYKMLEDQSNDYITNIDNQAIRTVVIKNWPSEEFLYTVFLRLNTGSKKLSPQELRQALKPGKFLDFLDKSTADSTIFAKMLNNKKPDPRMKDIELALRFFAYQYSLDKYDGNLKKFLDSTCELLNTQWDEKEDVIISQFASLENAIEFSYNIMDSKSPFSRYSNGQENRYFNRSIFEIFTYYFINEDVKKLVLENKDKFILKFKELNDKTDFIYATSDTTKSSDRVVIRHEMFRELLKELPNATGISVKKMTNSAYGITVEEVVL